MTELNFNVKCSRCLGTGVDPAVPNTSCSACNGAGNVPTGYTQSESANILWIKNKIKKILKKLDISEEEEV